MRIFWIVGFVIVAASFAFWRLSRTAHADSDAGRRLSALEKSINELSEKRESPAPVILYQTIASREAKAEPAPAPTASGAVPDGQIEVQVQEQLKTKFETEGLDQAWAASTEQRVLSGLKQLESPERGGGFRDVQCRASMCRLIGHFDSSSSFTSMMKDMLTPLDQAADAIIGEHGGLRRGAYTKAEDGSIEVQVYMFRQGQDFDVRSALRE